MGPEDLAQALCGLKLQGHPQLLIGPETADDAGVYRLTDEIALVLTLDFFTPIVDDPALFGQIAAANALSDVYAMGGQPICAMNIVAFPLKTLGIDLLRAVLEGGLGKLREVGVPLVGGHSIDDKELKYGMSVTGVVHPDRIWTNLGAMPGDRLVVTKPIGTGVVGTAVKRQQASSVAAEAAARSMATVNREAADLLRQHGDVQACTDVTGFGLLGHACEMIADNRVGMVIETASVPLLPGALDYCGQGLTPGGLKRNRDHRASQVDVEGVAPALCDLLYDPQTSGGLLAAVPPAGAGRVVELMLAQGIQAAVVGEVTDRPGRITLR